ncbi:MAG: acyloxyacyl hydrolase [Burkholderiaceae bacterium]|nr:acyloxyacyl hydrolase [Burkholderiaceae bacterium]
MAEVASGRSYLRCLWTAAMLVGGVTTAAAQDATALALGRAPGVNAVQGALVWSAREGDPRWRWLDWTGAAPRLEATASMWHGRANVSENATLLGVGLQPLLRWTLAPRRSGLPFVDFGIGPRLWSGKRIGAQQRFGTAFEFGTVLGLGIQRDGHDLYVRLEHTSNGGCDSPIRASISCCWVSLGGRGPGSKRSRERLDHGFGRHAGASAQWCLITGTWPSGCES